MSARTLLRDSGGVARQWKRVFLRDGAGVTRAVKRLFLRDASGIARLIFSGADYFTIFCGTANNSNGYLPAALGNIQPNNILGDGATIQQITVSNNQSPQPGVLILSINGPLVTSSAYLISLTMGGHLYLASAASFAGGGQGTGQWTWTGAAVFNGTVPGIIQRA